MRAERSQDVSHIQQNLAASAFFRPFLLEEQAALARTAVVERFGPGTTIVAAREVADKLRLVVTGRVAVESGGRRRQSGQSLELGPSCAFGQGPVNGAPEFEAHEAMSDVLVYGWSKDALDRLFLERPAMQGQMTTAVSLFRRAPILAAGLRQTPTFAEATQTDLLGLIRRSALVPYQPQDRVFEASQPPTSLYLLVAGAVRVDVPGGLRSEYCAGDLFGYEALLREQPHRSNAVALERSEVLEIDKAAFDTLRRQSPELSAQVELLRQRKEHHIETLNHSAHSVVLLNRTQLRTESLVRRLAEAMAALWAEPTIIVRLGEDSTELGDELRAYGEHVSAGAATFETLDPRLKHWMEARKARRILLFCDHVDPRIEEGLTALGARMVVLSPQSAHLPGDAKTTGRSVKLAVVRGPGGDFGAVPPGAVRLELDRSMLESSATLAQLPAETRNSIHRWARSVTGRSLGLALGGGGAWGYAHLPLLRAMVEEGLAPDAISGANFGAVVGAAYAAKGLDGLQALERWGPILDRLIRLCPISTYPMGAFLERVVSDGRLESLLPAFFPVAVDLLDGCETVFRHGAVADAVRASCAFPGIFPPVKIEGHRYVDGGVTNNVPVSTLTDEGMDFVVASDVTQKQQQTRSAEDGPLSRWVSPLSLRRRVADGMRAMFTMMEIRGHENAETAAIAFRPHMPGFLASDFRKAGDIVHGAERHVEAFLPGLKERYSKFSRGAQ